MECIKDFDKNTKDKVKGRYRLLLVDGHNSHYTRGFLEYACTYQIIVLCYPAHTTHLLQGLDVVVFAPLKHWMSYERDKWERETGESVNKGNFLTIYGRAYLRTLTPKNIKAAFRKTGIWPYNRDVISTAGMAPSKETLSEAHLPIKTSTDVQAVVSLLKHMSLAERTSLLSSGPTKSSSALGNGEGSTHTTGGEHAVPIKQANVQLALAKETEAVSEAIDKLRDSDMAYLVASEPPNSQSTIPPIVSAPILISAILFSDYTPQTPTGIALLAALRESEVQKQQLRKHCIKLQAASILNELYCGKLRTQLAHQEEKKRAEKGKGKLMGDGLPCMLTGDDFYKKVVNHEANQQKAAKAKADRAEERAGLADVLAKWKKEEV